MSTTLVIDASSFQYRAFYAALPRPTYTKDGTPNYAVNLFRTMLYKIRKDYAPSNIAAALDCPEPTFRRKLYPDYKATRRTPPAEYIAQLPGFRAILQEFAADIHEMPGFEADDIIGTLAKHTPGNVLIASGDKDMAQLVSDYRVRLLNTNKSAVLESAQVIEQYGVRPEQIPDLLALIGDVSDNVPGCKGIGDKGAVELLRKFGTVENLLSRHGEVQEARYRRALITQTETVLLSKKLATIDCDVPSVIACIETQSW